MDLTHRIFLPLWIFLGLFLSYVDAVKGNDLMIFAKFFMPHQTRLKLFSRGSNNNLECDGFLYFLIFSSLHHLRTHFQTDAVKFSYFICFSVQK